MRFCPRRGACNGNTLRGMKTLLSILVFTAAITQSLFAQTTTLTFPQLGGTAQPVRLQNIPVLAGEVFEVLTWASSNSSGIGMSVDGVYIPLAPQISAGGEVSYNPQRVTVAGPKTVTIEVVNNQALLCTYKMTALTATATVNVASQAVVIPADATAPVDIIFESSTDLITWTAAVAGSYSPSTSKRFFRVRAVAH